jgi:plasmid stability protein
MATLTIRNLDDPLKTRLRQPAAARNRAMEEGARQTLRAALQEPALPEADLGTRIRARLAAFGDVQLAQALREALRPPPGFDEPAAAAAHRRVETSARRARPRRP